MEEQHSLTVRSAVRSDLDAVAGVWRESALSMDGAAQDVPSREALRQRIDAELSDGWDLRVAVAGERVIGLLAIKPSDSILDQVFVAPSEQRKGVGTALIDVAKQSMPNGFSLRMDAANDQARRFYEKQGMELVGKGIHPRTGIPVHFYGWVIR